MTVAIVFNKQSSLTSHQLEALGSSIMQFFQGSSFVACRGYGHHYVAGATVLEVEEHSDYKTQLAAMVDSLLAAKITHLVTVGGDGLASYIASQLIRRKAQVTLLGIAAGTANVGPIVSYTAEEFASLKPSDLEEVAIDGIAVSDESGFLGVGFNDVILGNSFLGTEDGVCCNLSVEELLLHNKRVPISVGKHVVSDQFSITVDGKKKDFDASVPIEQIVISSMQFDQLYGRAIMGALCLGKDRECLGAVGLCSRNVVDCNPESWNYSGFTTMQHLVFSEQSRVEFSSLGPDAHIVIDGNPFLRHGKVTCTLLGGAVKALKHKRGL